MCVSRPRFTCCTASCRPEPPSAKTPRRRAWEAWHKYSGRVAIVLGIINCFFGIHQVVSAAQRPVLSHPQAVSCTGRGSVTVHVVFSQQLEPRVLGRAQSVSRWPLHCVCYLERAAGRVLDRHDHEWTTRWVVVPGRVNPLVVLPRTLCLAFAFLQNSCLPHPPLGYLPSSCC